MSAYDWEELRGLTLARQFAEPAAGFPPETPGPPAGLVADALRRSGPVQSQTARSPYVGLAARAPGVTHAMVTAAYESLAVVRGSTVRGTVHTSTAEQHLLLEAAAGVGQRQVWRRHLGLESAQVEELWRSVEAYAADAWRTPDELLEHLRGWLREHAPSSVPALDSLDRALARYLAFGYGGLVRRPLSGPWSGQGRAGYRAAASLVPHREVPSDPLAEVLRLHLSCHGPATRRDLAWWSGLGLRQVDDALQRLDPQWREGPGGQAYADLPGAPPAREVRGVHLLPEFDAVICGYAPVGRARFVTAEHLSRLWSRADGYLLAPLLVDGRVAGHWRLEGAGRTRTLVVRSYPGARVPRRGELAGPVASLAAALDVEVGALDVAREP